MDNHLHPSIYGRYILLRKFAIGGMAEVFRAKSFGAEDFEKLLAIKRLYPHLSEDASFVQMFINEAKLAATLNHVNVTPIYDFGCQQGLYYIAMEYVRGCDLADLIARCRVRKQQIPLGLAIWLLVEICNGLDYAHRKHNDLGQFLNLIHRDITPQNILISYEGEVKITDFGIAKVQMLERDETTGGLLKGKFSYMSPEQVRGDRLDHRSDIFSLGIVAWELLTSHKMFEGPNDYYILEKVREADYIPPRQLNPQIPVDVEQIVTKALTRYPNDRYQSVGQMRLALLRYLSNSRLFPSRAHLSAFVRKLFDDRLAREQEEIQEETRVARRIWATHKEEIETALQRGEEPRLSAEALQEAENSAAAGLDDEDTLPPQEVPSAVSGGAPPGAYMPHPEGSTSHPGEPIPHPGRLTAGPVPPPPPLSHEAHPIPSSSGAPEAGGADGGPSWQVGEELSAPPPAGAGIWDTIGMPMPEEFETDEPTLPDVSSTPPMQPPPPGLQPPLFPFPSQPHLTAPPPGVVPPPLGRPGSPPAGPSPRPPTTSSRADHDVLAPEDDLILQRFRQRKNLSLVVGLSTFLIGVLLVLLLAQWFFPRDTNSSSLNNANQELVEPPRLR